MIVKVTYPNNTIVHYPTVVDTTSLGNIFIEYTITNKRGGVASNVNVVTIVARENIVVDKKDEATIYSRFVADLKLDDGKNAKETINSKSIWNSKEYKRKLDEALSNEHPLKTYDYINSKEYQRKK